MIDVLFVAWNRLEFTKETLRALVANTDWSIVRRLIIHDDGSSDGTAEYLDALKLDIPSHVEIHHGRIGSPTGVTNLYLREPDQLFLAKIDNDAMMPPGWLGDALSIMVTHPELSVLGMGAWMPPGPRPRIYERAKAVGGICLMRSNAFACCLPWEGGRWGGSQMWQADHGQERIILTGPPRPEKPPHRRAVMGWMNPGIPVFLLDQMPMEPWISLSEQYIAEGWQRRWPRHSESDSELWSWWEMACAV